MRGGFEAAFARQRVGLGKQLGRAVDLSVVDANTDDFVHAMVKDPLHHFQRFAGGGFAVDGGHQPARDAMGFFSVSDGTHDGLQSVWVGDARVARRAGGVPKKLGVPNLMAAGVLQILQRDAVKVIGAAHKPLVQGPQHAQHAHRFAAARVESGKLFIADGGARTLRQVSKSFAPNRAVKMIVQADLG